MGDGDIAEAAVMKMVVNHNLHNRTLSYDTSHCTNTAKVIKIKAEDKVTLTDCLLGVKLLSLKIQNLLGARQTLQVVWNTVWQNYGCLFLM